MKEASEIEVLEGLEAVRRRPAMYLGPLGDPLLATRLLLEAFCIARDEAAAGACSRVSIELGRTGEPPSPTTDQDYRSNSRRG